MKLLGNRVLELEEEQEEIAVKKKQMQEQALSLAKEIAVLKLKNKQMAAELEKNETAEGRLPDLPVVVGQHISKVRKLSRCMPVNIVVSFPWWTTAIQHVPPPDTHMYLVPDLWLLMDPQHPEIGEFRGRPEESYNLVVQKSKLAVYRDQSRAVMAAQREARAYDMKVWMAQEEKRMGKDILEELITRLKDAQEKVKEQSTENVKQDMVTALKLFFSSKEQLVKVRRLMPYPLLHQWHCHRLTQASVSPRWNVIYRGRSHGGSSGTRRKARTSISSGARRKCGRRPRGRHASRARA
jgi:hypothetical protein